jgi:hypothetical protein
VNFSREPERETADTGHATSSSIETIPLPNDSESPSAVSCNNPREKCGGSISNVFRKCVSWGGRFLPSSRRTRSLHSLLPQITYIFGFNTTKFVLKSTQRLTTPQHFFPAMHSDDEVPTGPCPVRFLVTCARIFSMSLLMPPSL